MWVGLRFWHVVFVGAASSKEGAERLRRLQQSALGLRDETTVPDTAHTDSDRPAQGSTWYIRTQYQVLVNSSRCCAHIPDCSVFSWLSRTCTHSSISRPPLRATARSQPRSSAMVLARK